MSDRSFECSSRRALSRALLPLLLGLLVGACSGKHDGDKPALQGAPASASTQHATPGKTAFALVSASSETAASRTALTLRFNATLASAQAFDTLIAVTGPNGEVVNGSWSLKDDGKTLSFPFVQSDTHYAVQLKPGVLAADGRTLGHAVKHDIYSGNLPAAIGFASHGSVLPARGSRGLPLVSMNVHDADVEFFRVHDEALSDLFCAYPRNGHRDTYELDHDVSSYNDCGQGDDRRSRIPLTQLGDSVYANHYTLGGDANERTVTYLPVQDIQRLAEPGVYVAVVKAGGTFKDGYDTATFFVSDLGLHLRMYRDNALLHVASLRDGSPVNAVDVEIRDEQGRSKLKASTDADGNALMAYKVKIFRRADGTARQGRFSAAVQPARAGRLQLRHQRSPAGAVRGIRLVRPRPVPPRRDAACFRAAARLRRQADEGAVAVRTGQAARWAHPGGEATATAAAQLLRAEPGDSGRCADRPVATRVPPRSCREGNRAGVSVPRRGVPAGAAQGRAVQHAVAPGAGRAAEAEGRLQLSVWRAGGRQPLHRETAGGAGGASAGQHGRYVLRRSHGRAAEKRRRRSRCQARCARCAGAGRGPAR